MDEAQFLAEAGSFIEWLIDRLDGGGLVHCWKSRSGKTGVKIDDSWTCSSFYDAFDQYLWPATCPTTGTKIRTFGETTACLKQIQEQLLLAMSADDSDSCRELCCQILKWGGVDRNQHIAKQLLGLGASQPAYLRAIQGHFARTDLDAKEIETSVKVAGIPLRIELDSGTTKIFSLICPEFVIYDGRVGAALGHLVARWNKDIQGGRQAAIPASLWFAWGDRSNKGRDPMPPGCSRHRFPLLRNDNGFRISHNLRANWLCRKLALESDGTRFAQLGGVAARMRAIEAALFMIGYGVK